MDRFVAAAQRQFILSDAAGGVEGLLAMTAAAVQAAVPPTVSPSISRVGWPTPAGIDWPPLPQMPTPSSRAMSLPIPPPLVSTVGPSPIKVAPLIGAPRRPFSIL